MISENEVEESINSVNSKHVQNTSCVDDILFDTLLFEKTFEYEGRKILAIEQIRSLLQNVVDINVCMFCVKEFIRLDCVDDAIQALDCAIEIDAAYISFKVQTLWELGYHDDAIDCGKGWIHKHGGNESISFIVAEYLLMQDQYSEAKIYLDDCLQYNTIHPFVYGYLGTSLIHSLCSYIRKVSYTFIFSYFFICM